MQPSQALFKSEDIALPDAITLDISGNNITPAKGFKIESLFKHLGHSKDQPIPYQSSDVTAFMSFFSHWISHKFQEVMIEGIEHISTDRHHIFISNHRDILLDPALVNHALLSCGYDAARSVIGSNLMEEETMASLMKLAGCMEVPRGNGSIRQKFNQLKGLSHEIQTALQHNNVWIAQREGRTKNGIDETNPAIFKMIAMAKPNQMPNELFLKTQSIIPISISYQWDPSDTHKALDNLASDIGEQNLNTRIRSDTILHLINSLDRCEGKIKLCFGAPLKESSDINGMVQQLDLHIKEHYCLFDSHKVAYNLTQHKMVPHDLAPIKEKLLTRSASLPFTAQNHLIQSYANSYTSCS